MKGHSAFEGRTHPRHKSRRSQESRKQRESMRKVDHKADLPSVEDIKPSVWSTTTPKISGITPKRPANHVYSRMVTFFPRPTIRRNWQQPRTRSFVDATQTQ